MVGRLAWFSLVLMLSLVAASVFAAFISPPPIVVFDEISLANLSGFLALFFIAAAALMMVFRKAILGRTKNPTALRWVHVVVSGAGGLFLLAHVVVLVSFPLTIPVVVGYIATVVSLSVWGTGEVILVENDHGPSHYYHGLLTLVGVALILVHVFSAGRGIPFFIAGLTLTITASILVAVVVVKPVIDLFRARN